MRIHGSDVMWHKGLWAASLFSDPSTGLWTNEGVGVEQSQHHLRERMLQGGLESKKISVCWLP